MTIHDSQEPRNDHSGYQRLEDQIEWYDKKSISSQQSYRNLKVAQIIVAALVPVIAIWRPEDALIPGSLGALILILEGIQELGQYRQNWQKYRTACEALKHEKYIYIALTGPYHEKSGEDAMKLLAERVEAQISQEHTNWVKQFEKANGKADG